MAGQGAGSATAPNAEPEGTGRVSKVTEQSEAWALNNSLPNPGPDIQPFLLCRSGA